MLFADQPINNSKDDTLSRIRYVEEVSKRILEWKSRDSLVIGIYGRWGDGKSSILNLLNQKMEDQALVSFFDPWYFNSQDVLIKTFFSQLIQNISTKLPLYSEIMLRLTAKSFVQKLTSLPISINYAGLGLSLGGVQLKENPSEQKAAISKSLVERRKYDNRKIIVIIDNLDRLEPAEIMLMLKLIRLCSDFEDIVYVLAFDDRYVIQAINDRIYGEIKSITGDEYLKKIIQIDLRLPAINLNDIDKFINSALTELEESYHFKFGVDFYNRFPPFYQDFIRGKIIRNLRDAKKFINAVAFSLPIVLGEVNYDDWLVLEAMHVFSPISYSLLQDNIDILAPDYVKLSFGSMDYKRHQINESFGSFGKKLPSDNNEFITNALKYLFPVYRSWLSNPNNPTQFYADASYTELKAQQRIASPEYRFAYFHFGPKMGELTDTVISKLILDINNIDTAILPKTIKDKLLILKQENHLQDAFDKLVLRVAEIDRKIDATIIQVVASLANIYSIERGFVSISEEDRARALIFSLISQNKGNDVQMLLELAIEKASSDSFAIKMVVFSAPERNRIIKDFDTINYQTLNAKLKARLQMNYCDGKRDIFELDRSEYGYILYHWAGPLLNDKDVVASYLDLLFRRNPKYIGKFLEIFVSPNPITEKPVFNIEEFTQAFDVDWMKSHITVTDTLFTTSNEQFALEEFKSKITL